MHGATEAPKTSVIVGLLIQADKAGALARFEGAVAAVAGEGAGTHGLTT